MGEKMLVRIELNIDVDNPEPDIGHPAASADPEDIREAVYQYLRELMEDGSLHYETSPE